MSSRFIGRRWKLRVGSVVTQRDSHGNVSMVLEDCPFRDFAEHDTQIIYDALKKAYEGDELAGVRSKT